MIDRVQEGDDSALQELLCRYQSRVLSAVRLRLGAGLRRKLESNDIVQEVMIDAFGRVKAFEFRNEKAFLHFLNRVVVNKIRDEADRWKAEMRNPAREAARGDGSTNSSANPPDVVEDRAIQSPSRIVSVREDLHRLERAMDLLGEESEEYRELVIAVKLDERSYREIAEERDVSEDAVRMKAKRAILKLTDILAHLPD